MTINQNDVLRVAVEGDFDLSEQLVNVYQFQKISSGALSEADVLDDLIELFEVIQTGVATILNILAVFRSLRVYNLTQDALVGEIPFAAPIAGDLGNGVVVAGACALVTFKTFVPRVFTRKYLGVLDESTLNGQGQFTGGALADIEDYAAFLLQPQAVTNGEYQYGILSSVTSTFLVPNGGYVYAEPAYQRRRRRGTGS